MADDAGAVLYEDRPRPGLPFWVLSSGAAIILVLTSLASVGEPSLLFAVFVFSAVAVAVLAAMARSVRYVVTESELQCRAGFRARTLQLWEISEIARERPFFGLVPLYFNGYARLSSGSWAYADPMGFGRRAVYIGCADWPRWFGPWGSFWLTPSDPDEFIAVLERQIELSRSSKASTPGTYRRRSFGTHAE